MWMTRSGRHSERVGDLERGLGGGCLDGAWAGARKCARAEACIGGCVGGWAEAAGGWRMEA